MPETIVYIGNIRVVIDSEKATITIYNPEPSALHKNEIEPFCQ